MEIFMRNVICTAALIAALVGAPDPAAVKIQGPDTLGTVIPVQIVQAGAAALTQTQQNASATGANATTTATLSAVASRTNFLTGFEVVGDGSTAGGLVSVTVSGIQGGTLTYTLDIPAGVTSSVQLIVEFTYPLSANGQNVAIAVSAPAFGAGSAGQSVNVHGFSQ